jgi:GNAT superfamily N-acetyltransferase
MSLRIVRATPRELDLAVPLFDAYRQFYGQPSEPAGARAFLGERLYLGDSVVYLALDGPDDAPTAHGLTQLYASYSSVSMMRLWILNDLFVAPASRRAGVGRALLERARQLAFETGAKGLVLATAKDNARAKSLYESSGYRRDEVFDHYELVLGKRE